MECLKPKFIGYYVGRDKNSLKCNIIKYRKDIDITPLLMLKSNVVDFFVPCGHCILCRARKKRDMTTRLIHESKCFRENCFITLTYSPENLPFEKGYPTLVKKDVQNFLKRLRHHTPEIRYFAVGEYGSKFKRPHYHLLVFGWFPHDSYIFQFRKKYNIFRSPLIEKCWKKGFSTVGLVNSSVAHYCAQYVVKKSDSFLPPSGVSEFFLASKMKGGIGAKYLDSYVDDIVNLNSCLLMNSQGSFYKTPIPSYYINRIKNKHFKNYRQLVETWESFKFDSSEKTYDFLISKAKAIEEKLKQKNDKKELHND